MTTKTTGRDRENDREKWQQLKTILVDALEETSLAARTALVQNRCADDKALCREAQSLLAEAETLAKEPTDRFEDCAEKATAMLWHDDPHCDRRIGSYVTIREIGRGGMGAVYLAKRADGEFEKQVAIKILKRGTDTDELLRRFRAERQILAGLDHPNIARLLDAGTTDDGLPYFIMDYIVGEPVTRYLATHRLSIRDRLQLFLKICGAVEAAHQRLIVHRDLKPGNILVDKAGEPKLLDFGIAKLLAPGEDSLELTATGQERLTAICASPEQALGRPVTVASDIYALGALLYEMLTGEKPHQFSTPHPSRAELAQVIAEKDPTPPSDAVSDPAAKDELRGDVDQIVLRAMRKEPELRYQSIDKLTAHIRSFLAGERVHARQSIFTSRRQLDRKQRFRIPIGLALASVLILGGGLTLLFLSPAKLQRLLRISSETQLHSTLPIPDKSIAVLPFQNLSEQKENAFFADGVQDQILTDLAKVSDLRVISRTSVEQFRTGAKHNLREISQQLGAAHVLEGSVQRAGNRVRVVAKLVDARRDSQIWGETYDRELADVFAIQSDIAQAIVRQLQVRLLPQEKAGIEERPTSDLAAYDLYLRAKEIVDSHLDAQDPEASLLQAIRLLGEATRRDPKFTVAYSYTARAHSLLFGLDLDQSEARIRQADQALQAALRLRPDSAEAHLAKADYHFRCFLDLPAAQKELEIARLGLPNSTPLYVLTGNVNRRQNKWSEAERNFTKAVELDPRNPDAVNYLADTQILIRRFSDAMRTYEHARATGLEPPILSVRMAIIDFAATGSTTRLRAALSAAPPGLDVGGGETPLRILIALADHDYGAAERALTASPRTDFQDVDFSFYYPRSWYEGIIARAQGDQNKARSAFAATRTILEQRLKAMPTQRTRAVLAQVYAALGLRELAIREARQAVEMMPIVRDAYESPLVLQGLAQVYAWSNEKDRALELLETLVRIPGYLSYGYLRVDPAWEPLRGDPRFEAIVASLAPR
ncbi:MAG: FlgO family outer membrane protein [Chthoniobacterales bacterium]